MFDPGGSAGRVRACPFLGEWRALLCMELFVRVLDNNRGWSGFFGRRITLEYFPREVQLTGVAVDRYFSAARLV